MFPESKFVYLLQLQACMPAACPAAQVWHVHGIWGSEVETLPVWGICELLQRPCSA